MTMGSKRVVDPIAEMILLEVASRQDGRLLRRMDCPYCHGGSSGEKNTMSVCVNGGDVSWCCFRASCGKHGGNKWGNRPTPPAALRPFIAPTRELTDEEGVQYNLPPGYRVDIATGRVLLPIRDPVEETRGYIARDFSGELSPKVLTYKEAEGPFIHWAIGAGMPTDIVIVEDWLSAEAVGGIDNAVGVALLGTHCSDAAMEEIGREISDTVQLHVALDRDAFAKAIKLAANLAIGLNRLVFTWRLDKDLKHVRTERIERALHEREFDFISYP